MKELRQKASRSQAKNWPSLAQLTNQKTGKHYRPNNKRVVEFHKSAARYKALLGGLGSGKTAAGSIEAIKRIKAGLDGAIISPDHQHFVKSAFEEFSAWCPWQFLISQNKTEKWWLFDTGAKVFYGGIDEPDSWRGPNLNWIWFDEAARKKNDKAWKVLIARIRIGNCPQLFITTTPKPHWIKRVFVTNPPMFKGKPLSAYWKTSTRDNQKNLDPIYYASLISAYTGKYAAQELEGDFVNFEGLVYENISELLWPAGNLTDDDVDLTKENGVLKYPIEMAFDDGYVDPRAIYWIQKQPHKNRILVFDELYHSSFLENKSVEMVVQRCKEKEWPLPEIAIGSHEAITLREEFRRADIPARHAMHKIIEGIKNTRRFIKDGNDKRILAINRKRCPNLILELTEKYCYPNPEDITVRKNSELPIDQHNHAADAIRMWLWARGR